MLQKTFRLANQFRYPFCSTNYDTPKLHADNMIRKHQNWLPFYDRIDRLTHDVTIRRLCQHFPMVVISMMGMGATINQLKAFEKAFVSRDGVHYEKYYEPRGEKPEDYLINEKNLDRYLGEYQFFELFLHFFKHEAKTMTPQELIVKYLPKFSKGIGSEAFHIIIKLGFSAHYQFNKEEVLQSLAYLMCQSTTIDYSNFKSTKTNIYDLLHDIQQHKATFVKKTTFHKALVYNHQLRYLMRDEEFSHFLPKNRMDIKLNEMHNFEEMLVKLYLHTEGSFLTLHAIQGYSCLKQILPLFDEKTQIDLIHDFIIHYLVAFATDKSLVYDMEALKPGYDGIKIPKELKSWQEIKQRALNSFDDHDIQTVFICEFEANHISSTDPSSKLVDYYKMAAMQKLEML